MPPHLAAASTLALIAAVITLGYAGACAVRPFAPCRKCSGTGRKHPPQPGRARLLGRCRRCKGTGARLRAGRRAWNLIRELHREGTR